MSKLILFGAMAGILWATGSQPAFGANDEQANERWIIAGPYDQPCTKRPKGMICIAYDDGYIWLAPVSVYRWEKREEYGHEIQVAVTNRGRYEHILGSLAIRIVR